MSADIYFEKVDSTLKDLALELRLIIKEHFSVLKEEIKWNVPTYSLNNSVNKNICSIMVHKSHVNFQIFKGAHIKDSQDLEGVGKDMRHLKFSTLDELDSDKLKSYLVQAIELNS